MHNVDICQASETIKWWISLGVQLYIYFKVMITPDIGLYCASVTVLLTWTSNCTVQPAHLRKNKYNTKHKPNYNTQFVFVQVFNIQQQTVR